MIQRTNVERREARMERDGLREVVKTTILEQDPPHDKIDGGLCLHPPSSTSKYGVFIA